MPKSTRVGFGLAKLGLLGVAALVASAAGACGGSSSTTPGPKVAGDGEAPTVASTCAAQHDHASPVGFVAGKPRQSSSVVLTNWAGKRVALVADEDTNAIVAVDVDAEREIARTELGARPGELMMLEDGRVVVALRDSSKLAVLEPGADPSAPLETRCAVAAAPEPIALATTPDEGRLLVTSGWGHKLATYRLEDNGSVALHGAVDLAREPRTVVISSDGTKAYIGHVVGSRVTTIDLAEEDKRHMPLFAVHDHELDELRSSLGDKLSQGDKPMLAKELGALEESLNDKDNQMGRRRGCQGYTLTSTLDGRILAPQVLVDPGTSESRTAGYGDENTMTEVPSVAVIDEDMGRVMPASMRVDHRTTFIHNGMQEGPEPCVLPRSSAYDKNRDTLLVGCYGIDSVVAYDASSPDPVNAELRRWRVGAGPSGIAVDADKRQAVVFSQFDRVVNIIPLGRPLEGKPGADDANVIRVELTSAPGEPDIAVALGRSLFHSTGDARVARDGRACASCHPDGREDGLTWATPNGPRRTKLLAGRLEGTAPFSWDGNADHLHVHLKETFERLGGVGGLRSIELKALVAYLESLDPPPTYAANTSDPKVKRGAAIFASEEAGCASCHGGSALTDNKIHDVDSKTPTDRNPTFNTPSLRFISGRAPYYHDGRYETLRDLLWGVDGSMGHTRHLSPEDLDALEAYLETL